MRSRGHVDQEGLALMLGLFRRPLALSAFAVATASAQTGTVAGVITVDSTRGVANARISAKGAAEVRTDSSGRFVLRNVPIGTQEVTVRAIGLDPAAFDVNVTANDTTRVQINLDTKVPVLDSVKIKGQSKVRDQLQADFIERRKMGFGHFADSTEIASHPLLMNAFDVMPGVRVIRKGGGRDFSLQLRGDCTANVWVDGVRQRELTPRSGYKPDFSFLAELDPTKIAAIEVYPSEMTSPPQYSAKGCGSVLVWTKRSWP